MSSWVYTTHAKQLLGDTDSAHLDGQGVVVSLAHDNFVASGVIRKYLIKIVNEFILKLIILLYRILFQRLGLIEISNMSNKKFVISLHFII